MPESRREPGGDRIGAAAGPGARCLQWIVAKLRPDAGAPRREPRRTVMHQIRCSRAPTSSRNGPGSAWRCRSNPVPPSPSRKVLWPNAPMARYARRRLRRKGPASSDGSSPAPEPPAAIRRRLDPRLLRTAATGGQGTCGGALRSRVSRRFIPTAPAEAREGVHLVALLGNSDRHAGRIETPAQHEARPTLTMKAAADRRAQQRPEFVVHRVRGSCGGGPREAQIIHAPMGEPRRLHRDAEPRSHPSDRRKGGRARGLGPRPAKGMGQVDAFEFPRHGGVEHQRDGSRAREKRRAIPVVRKRPSPDDVTGAQEAASLVVPERKRELAIQVHRALVPPAQVSFDDGDGIG